ALAIVDELVLYAGVVSVGAACRLSVEAHAQRRCGTEAVPAAPQPGEFVHVAADGLGVGEHPPGRRQQGLTGRGQRDVPVFAVEELSAELLLLRRDLAAQRRVVQMQVCGGLRKRDGRVYL